MTSLAGFSNLGNIQSEKVRETTGNMPMGVPSLTSGNAPSNNVDGAIRTIILTGYISGTIQQHTTFINELILVVENQEVGGPPIAYQSDLYGQMSVKIDTFDTDYVAGQPNWLLYTLHLTRASI